jgi:DNA-binding SARP family transcriptional activator
LERLRDEVERLGIPWLDRVTRAVLVVFENDSTEVLDDLAAACQREGDTWGEAIISLVDGGVRIVRKQSASIHLARAAELFTRIGAGTLTTCAMALAALDAHVRGDDVDARRQVEFVHDAVLQMECPKWTEVAQVLQGIVDGHAGHGPRSVFGLSSDMHWLRRLNGSAQLGRDPSTQGVDLPSIGSPPEEQPSPPYDDSDSGPTTRPKVRLRCLGPFSLEIAGRVVDESTIKPKERALLHRLVLRPGEPVHRDELLESLWPEADPDVGRHRLQVAISSLRRLVTPEVHDQPYLLAREGESYRIRLDDDADVDLWQVETQLRKAKEARAANDVQAETRALVGALGAWSGSLFPSDGPAEWVVGTRARLEMSIVAAAARLASIQLQTGDSGAAADAARAGLAIDRYRDDLWELLITASRRSGHQAEALRAQTSYREILVELGV